MKTLILTLAFLCGSALSQESLPDAPSKHSSAKLFIAAHAVFLASTVYDVEVTHQGLAHHKCVEMNGSNPYPSRGELYRRELLLFAGITAMDYLFRRAHIRLAPYAGAVTGTAIHLRAGTEWFTQGCY